MFAEQLPESRLVLQKHCHAVKWFSSFKWHKVLVFCYCMYKNFKRLKKEVIYFEEYCSALCCVILLLCKYSRYIVCVLLKCLTVWLLEEAHNILQDYCLGFLSRYLSFMGTISKISYVRFIVARCYNFWDYMIILFILQCF